MTTTLRLAPPTEGTKEPAPLTDSVAGTAPTLPAVLIVDDLATLLRLDRKTVYAALNNGDIPGARRIGRTIRISRDAVLRWLADGQGRVPHSRRKR